MKFSRIDLLTLLISLFILSSCKNQNTIGLNIGSAGQISGTLTDTATIIINTVPEDSVSTTNLDKKPFGYFNDPMLGITQADLATDLNLPGSTGYTLPAGTITIDSAVVVMYYADGFYGSGLESKFTASVYQLNENFSHTTTYYSNKVWNYNANVLLGSRSFNANTKDSVKINRIIAGAPDTLYKVAPQLRIKISPNFINTNLFNANSTTLGTNAIFQNSVKGLYIKIDKSKTSGAGGIFMISADSIQVYYKALNGLTVDTGEIVLPMSTAASAITHTYTPAVQAALSNKSSSNKTVYLQGPAGLKAKISFPNFLQNIRNGLLARDSDIVLNRAELVITPMVTPVNTVIPFGPLPKITMYTLDIAHVPVPLEDATTSDPRAGGISVFGGFYTLNKQNYHFVITAFLQDLLLKRTVDYGTYIAPVDTTNLQTVDYAETPQVAARTIVVGTDKTSPYRIVLNVIYTKIRKSY